MLSYSPLCTPEKALGFAENGDLVFQALHIWSRRGAGSDQLENTMNTFTQVGTALAIAALTATSAAAQATYKKVGSEAGWDIYVNENTNGCLMAKGVGTDRSDPDGRL